MKKILIIITSIIVIMALTFAAGIYFTGRNLKQGKFPKPQENPTISEFDLGEVNLPQSFNPDYPVRLHGEIGVPAGEGKHPIVFILHGSHPVTTIETERYDLGFTYLVEELARNGYIAVTLNVNAQYVLDHYGEPFEYERLSSIFNEHLLNLERAINGEDVGYGIDLTNRGDLSNINLIGHSRSGQGIMYIYDDQKDKGTEINSLLALAPSLVIVYNDYPNVPIGIVLPELDGDVRGLAGQDIYENLRFDKNRTAWSNLVYLYGANHNFFNEELKFDDSELEKASSDIRLSANEQRNFFKKYAVDFLNSTNNKINNLEYFNTETLYGEKVLTSFYSHDTLIIVRPEDNKNIDYKHENANVKQVFETSYFKEDTAGPFRLPGLRKDMHLLNIEWQEKANISFEYDGDISTYDYLSLYVAIDSSNELNNKMNQAITIELEDKDGKTSKVILDNKTPALTYQSGELYSDKYASMWTSFTPLSNVFIPIKDFDVDLNNIESISLIFDQTPSGSIMLGEISVLKN